MPREQGCSYNSDPGGRAQHRPSLEKRFSTCLGPGSRVQLHCMNQNQQSSLETQVSENEALCSGDSGLWDSGTWQYPKLCEARCSSSKNPNIVEKWLLLGFWGGWREQHRNDSTLWERKCLAAQILGGYSNFREAEC